MQASSRYRTADQQISFSQCGGRNLIRTKSPGSGPRPSERVYRTLACNKSNCKISWKLRIPANWRPTTRWRQLQSGLPGLPTTIWVWWWLWSLWILDKIMSLTLWYQSVFTSQSLCFMNILFVRSFRAVHQIVGLFATFYNTSFPTWPGSYGNDWSFDFGGMQLLEFNHPIFFLMSSWFYGSHSSSEILRCDDIKGSTSFLVDWLFFVGKGSYLSTAWILGRRLGVYWSFGFQVNRIWAPTRCRGRFKISE